jgi:hypothetical protein
MKNLFVIAAILVGYQSISQNQLVADSTIKVNNISRNYRYKINGRALTRTQVVQHLYLYKSSGSEFDKSLIHRTIAWAFTGSGFTFMWIPLPGAILAMPIGVFSGVVEEVIANKHLKKSIELYNKEVHNNTPTNPPYKKYYRQNPMFGL